MIKILSLSLSLLIFWFKYIRLLSVNSLVDLSEGISHLLLKMLIELCALDEAVSETGLLVSQKLVLGKADHAA
jgi:hypothetical protein